VKGGRHKEADVLELIVFISGGVLLALEIWASRVLAPFFGNSVYVWGSLIGVFLAGLSLGYYVGGQVPARRPSPALFSGLVFLAGLLAFPIPFISRQVMEALVLADVGPRAGPLAASTILFFLPTLLMGFVVPLAVLLLARTVPTVGNVAGVLYALSTLAPCPCSRSPRSNGLSLSSATESHRPALLVMMALA